MGFLLFPSVDTAQSMHVFSMYELASISNEQQPRKQKASNNPPSRFNSHRKKVKAGIVLQTKRKGHLEAVQLLSDFFHVSRNDHHVATDKSHEQVPAHMREKEEEREILGDTFTVTSRTRSQKLSSRLQFPAPLIPFIATSWSKEMKGHRVHTSNCSAIVKISISARSYKTLKKLKKEQAGVYLVINDIL